MKIGLIALLFILLTFGTSKSETKTIPKQLKCDNTTVILSFLQKETFLPRLAATLIAPDGTKIFETIFINIKDKDVAVIETRIVDNESISCFASVGSNYMAVDQNGLISGPFGDL